MDFVETKVAEKQVRHKFAKILCKDPSEKFLGKAIETEKCQFSEHDLKCDLGFNFD